MLGSRVRKDPLGPQTLNQLQANVDAVEGLALSEHSNDGQHNALEVPWVLGHMVDGSPPTGYLFDSAFGGGTLARTATGVYTSGVVSGVITSSTAGDRQCSVMANVSGAAIASKPHTISYQVVNSTLVRFRVRSLTSALGAGDAWADANCDIDVGVHALRKDSGASLNSAHLDHQRGDFLTEAATDWNALVSNQGGVMGRALLEHSSTGAHRVNRVSKAVGWFRPSGGVSYSILASQGVASVTRVGLGIIDVTMSDNFTSTDSMATFPEAQPIATNELVIINGHGFATGAGTSKFRYYIYVYDGANWALDDRPFFAPMFGAIA